MASDDGQKLLLNQPAAVEALQKIRIWSIGIMWHQPPLRYNWCLLRPSCCKQVRWPWTLPDIGRFWTSAKWALIGEWVPYFNEPTTIICGCPLGIFTTFKHQEEAFQLFKALGDTAGNDLFSNGLWMPLHVEDYTDPARISQWLNGRPGVYPIEAWSVLVDYTLNHTPRQAPVYWLRNYVKFWMRRLLRRSA